MGGVKVKIKKKKKYKIFIKKEQYNITNVGWIRNKRGRTRLGTSKEEQKNNNMGTITGRMS